MWDHVQRCEQDAGAPSGSPQQKPPSCGLQGPEGKKP